MKILGCDVAKDFIILHDGNTHYHINDINLSTLKELVENSIVVLEQTGAYGIRWAYILSDFGAKVFIADGKEFKAFRHGRDRRKDDWVDAYYLRLFFKGKTKRKYCKPFSPKMINLRSLIRQHIRNEKDITRTMNRLMQYTAVIFPFKNYYNLKRPKFLKALDEIERDLINSPHALSTLALMELRKLKTTLEEQKRLEEEVKTIARNHPDYEILKTFPSFGSLTIATLIAFYWSVENFTDLDAFIGYVLMGSIREQSGKSINRVKTDKARTEVKGKFFNLFRSSHIKNRRGYTHPYNPLAEVLKARVFGGWNMKKRYIKFLSRIFELVYYALEYRMTYEQVLRFKIRELQKNIERLRKSELDKLKAFELSRAIENLEVYKEMLSLVSECQDISDPAKSGAERPAYFGDKTRKEVSHESPNQTGTIPRDNPQATGKIPQPDPTDDRGRDNDVPKFLKRKSPERRSNHQAETLRDVYPQGEKDQEDEIPY